MSDELYINEQLIDLAPGTKIALTKQVHNLAVLKNRDATRTNQFKILPTRNNRRILGYADNLTSNTNAPYRKLPCKYFQNGIEIIADGYATIEESGEDFLVVVYSGIIDFFSSLGDDKLSDLNFDDLNHDWTPANALASHGNTDGYIYALADWGVTPTKNNIIQLKYQHHSIFVHDIVSRIFNERGWTITGSLVNHEFYNKLVIPFANGELKSSAVQDKKRFEVVTTTPQFYTLSGNNLIDFQSKVSDQLNYFDIGTNQFKPLIVMNAALRLTFRISDGKINSPTEMRIVQDRGGIVSDLAILEITTASLGNQLVIETSELEFHPGDIVSAQLFRDFPPSVIGFDAGITFESIVPDVVFPGDEILVSENVPDITQRKFLLNIFNIFAAIPDKLPYKNEIVVSLFNDIIENKPNAPDWSDKIDFSERPKMEFAINNYAQVNNLKFKEDDLLSEEIGTGKILVDDDTLENETDLIELDFAACESVFKLREGIRMASIGLYGIKDGESDSGYIDARLSSAQSWSGNNDNLVMFDVEFDNDSGYFNPVTHRYQPLAPITAGFRFEFVITSINVGFVWGDIRISIQVDNGFNITDLEVFEPNEDNDNQLIVMTTDKVSLSVTDTVKVQVDLKSGDQITIGAGAKFEVLVDRETKTPEPRIMAIKRKILSASYDDGITNNPFVSNTPIGYFIDPSQAFQCGFDSNIIDQFYKYIRQSLVKAKNIKVPMMLSVNDFHDIDHITPIYLNVASQEISGYFYLNKIDRYQKNKAATVELIRL